MSVATELTRIQTAKAGLKSAIEAKGVTVSSDATIDAYPALVQSIPSGGGGGSQYLQDLIEGDITSITIPSGIARIRDYAFAGCYALRSVTIPSSVTYIGYFAFLTCTELTSVNIPSGVTTIYGGAFQQTGFTSFTIPSTVNVIHDGVFNDCSRLASITLLGTPSTLTYTSYTKISPSAFNNSLWFDNQPDGVVYIDYIANTYKGWDYETPLNLTFSNNTKMIGWEFCRDIRDGIASVTIPDSVECVGETAFQSCPYLTSVTFGENVRFIGVEAFGYCTNITTVSIPNSIDAIMDRAFTYCQNLTSVTFGDGNDVCNLTAIGGGAFYECSNLTSVTINNPIGVPELGATAFAYTSPTIYVPADMVSEFEAAENWSDLNIQPIP